MGPDSHPGGSVSSLKTDGLASWDNGDAAVGKLVRPLVPGVTSVALDPAPGHRVPGQLGLQQPPQVGVLDRLLGGGDPAVPLPAGQPPRDPVHHVRGVDVQRHLALPGEGTEPFDDRGQLHPVVRREHLPAEQLALMAAPVQPRAPAARAGVALARAVGPHVDRIGACKGNPGPGGWGAWLHWGSHQRELFGGEVLTTNNRMELTAVIEGLRALTRECEVTLHVDSTYVMHGITRWLPGWKRNGWVTSAKQPVKNADLWRLLETELARHAVTWRWVKGHAGDPGNERADQLANRGVPNVPGGETVRLKT